MTDKPLLLQKKESGSRHGKTYILHMRKQRRRPVTAQLISAFVFTSKIVQFVFFLNPNFQAPNHLLWLYSSVCFGPGRKPRRQVFSCRGSIYLRTNDLSRDVRKPTFWFPTCSDTNQAVQLQKMVRGLKFWI